MIKYQAASTREHIEAILKLQQANLPKNISTQEAKAQGFVTVEHDIELLTAMNATYGHQIALQSGQLAGYALVMLRDFSKNVPVLLPFFDRLEHLKWEGITMSRLAYFVIGQLCVSKSFRGMGVSKGLYQHLGARMKNDFQLMVTEVSTRNKPSVIAHEKAGFQLIHQYHEKNGERWNVVGKNLKIN